MTQSNKSAWNDTLMNTYGTPPVTLVSGKGAHATGKDGTDYIDLLAGIAVNSLGHAHPAIVEAVSSQISTLGHVSNLCLLYTSHSPRDQTRTLVGPLLPS